MYFSKVYCDICGKLISENDEKKCKVFDLWFTSHAFEEYDYDDLDLDVCEDCEPDVRAAVQVAVEAIKAEKFRH